MNLGPRAAGGDYAPGFKIKLLQKDLRLVLGCADEMGMAVPNSSAAHQLYNSLEASGRGEEGTQALIRVFKQLASVE